MKKESEGEAYLPIYVLGPGLLQSWIQMLIRAYGKDDQLIIPDYEKVLSDMPTFAKVESVFEGKDIKLTLIEVTEDEVERQMLEEMEVEGDVN